MSFPKSPYFSILHPLTPDPCVQVTVPTSHYGIWLLISFEIITFLLPPKTYLKSVSSYLHISTSSLSLSFLILT